ncbi:hypothetical protein HMPREF9318_02065 [Streptococcus urinalis FB127-CNA-2]|uniref:Acetyltransferase, GNAT family n=1 Tax=Streptococcus urinalis 2285-97 TaxID=764291 RepID=G5KCH2_9STRE|nr:GNAT family N-acetyltransferase [Streptococcus urinalis]EHJ56593.1 acetyltransferase, GNAT family [Streptococcus urinalis 2285-97]EKS17188.1 hypothetical protein HMPREF9318_02065 [Streptococcus urinalis FB127-CNA-2]VEF32562.1 GNAT family acetyltransferase [Streptococcus urinalis]
MEIRLAFPNEINQIMEIIEEARQTIAAYGSDQWQDGYPNAQVIEEDILKGQGYVAIVEETIVAYCAAIFGNEEAYNHIYDGKWQTGNKEYLTFHRIAVSQKWQGKHIALTFLQGLIESLDFDDFRCDTHELNKGMQTLLSKLGFVYCGKVPLSGVRLAYQKQKQSFENATYQEVPENTY